MVEHYDRKYELIPAHNMYGPPLLHNGKPLYRLKALRKIIDPNNWHDGENGERIYEVLADPDNASCWGGLVESSDNLSHDGNCWITGDARAVEGSRVVGNCLLKDRAQLLGNSIGSGNSVIGGYTLVDGESIITGNALLLGAPRVVDSLVGAGAVVCGHAELIRTTVKRLRRSGEVEIMGRRRFAPLLPFLNGPTVTGGTHVGLLHRLGLTREDVTGPTYEPPKRDDRPSLP